MSKGVLLLRNPLLLAALVLLAALLLAYGFDLGHGLIKDDFGWVYEGQLRSIEDVIKPFAQTSAFYRPLVSLTFGLNELMFDMTPIGYGWTNFALLLACCAAIASLIRTMGMPPYAALLAAAVWAFNFHGINMAVLWASGRTSLLLTFFLALTLKSTLEGRRAAATVLCLCALCSKEEAVALPLISTLWLAASGRPAWRETWGQWAALALYFVLRTNAGAMTPASAPDFYRFTFEPSIVLRNVLEYADRSTTLAAVVAIAGLGYLRRMPAFNPGVRRWCAQGATLLLLGFAITVWLPVRSSLYAVMPSVGTVIVLCALVVATVPLASPLRVRRAVIVGLVLPFLLLPIYRKRNVRWVELGDLSAYVLRFLSHEAASLPHGALIELHDDPTTRANLASAFGTEYPAAVARLIFDNRLELWFELRDKQSAVRPTRVPAARYTLMNGALAPVGSRRRGIGLIPVPATLRSAVDYPRSTAIMPCRSRMYSRVPTSVGGVQDRRVRSGALAAILNSCGDG